MTHARYSGAYEQSQTRPGADTPLMVCYATVFHPCHERPIATVLYYGAQIIIGSQNEDTATLLERFFAVGNASKLTLEVFLRRCAELCVSGMRVELTGPPPWAGQQTTIVA